MRLLEDILAEEMLFGRLKDGDTSIVDIGEDGKAVVTPKQDNMPAAAPDLLAPVGE
jgi:ATP-dependent Clp protease ATP-binding subunit ClpC